ncbi:MAG: hypothetical protein V2I33_07085 [Kangiellaceae bacterium]|jgi:hypothetical protein|nr:hypothetical protein [Kangiellaceae bacterium]
MSKFQYLRRNYVTALILLILVGCATKNASKNVTNDTQKPVVSVESNKKSLVRVLSTSGFMDKEKVKLSQYIPVMDKTIGSECFETFMLARNMHTTQGKSNEEVVKHLRSSTVDIHLITYYKRWSKVAGYTYPDVNKIWLNRKYHAGASLCSEASNLAHELSHKLGYGHTYKATKKRPYSVPYSINAAFTACCE